MAVQTDRAALLARAFQMQQEDLQRQQAEEAQRAAEAQQQYDLTRSRSVGEFIQDVGVQALSGAVGLGQAGYGLANLATFGGLDSLTGMSENFDETQQTLQEWRSDPTQAKLQEMRRRFDEEGVGAGLGYAATNFATLQDLLVSNIPSLLPAAGFARAAGTAAQVNAATRGLSEAAQRVAAQRAAETAVLRTVGGQTAGAVNVDTINAIREAGGTEEQQQLGGMAAAGIAGLLAPAISKFTGAAAFESQVASAAARNFAGRAVQPIVGGAAREGIEEGLQSGVERAAQNLPTPGVGLGEGVGEAAGLGALTGSILGGGMGTLVAAGPRRESATREQIQQELLQADRELRGVLAPSVLGDAFDPAMVIPSNPELVATPEQRRATQAALRAATEQPMVSAAGPLRAQQLREQALAGVPQEAAGAPAEIASLEESVAQQLFRTELDDNNQLRFFRFNSQLQREEEVPAQAALATAASVIERGRVLQEYRAAERALPGLLPQVSEESGPASIDEVDFSGAGVPTFAVEEIAGAPELAQLQPPLPQVDFDTGPQAVEAAQVAQAPLRSLFDITGRQPQVAPLPAPAAPQPPATGARAVIEAQRGRGRLGGTDLFAGPLPPEGAFPAAQSAPAAEPAVPPVPRGQRELDFNAPLPTWKQFLARDLGVKPAALRGKAWDQFVSAAEAAGVTPLDASAPAFLAAQARAQGQDRERTPEFIARMADKYAPAPAIQQGTLEDALALSEDEYIAAINPTGKTTDEEDVITVRLGDLDLPQGAQLLESFNDSDGNQVDVYGADGNYYAVQNGQVVGQLERDGDETLNIVALEAQGRGIGTGLAKALIRREPFAPAGSLSPAGERTRRAAFRQLKNAQGAPEPVPQTAGTPGAPAETPALPVGLDANIEQQRANGSKYPEMSAFIDILEDAPNTEVLDDYYIAMKRHPSWQAMPAEQRQQVSTYYQERFHLMDGSSPGKFERAPVGEPKGMSQEQFDEALRFIGPTTWGVPVRGHSTVADFEAATGQVAPHDARGVFVGGQVHLIRENLPSTKELAMTLAHERGHAGMERLLGDRLTAATNRMWANATLRKRIQAKQDQLGLNRAVAAEEVLVDMLAGDERLAKDVWSKLRAGVNQFFADVLGYGDLVVSDREVDQLLHEVSTVLRGQPGAVLDTRRPDSATQQLKEVMGAPAQITAGEPRFSRAVATLESMVEDAKADSTSNDNKMLQVSKDVMQGSADKLRGLQSFIKDGGIRGALLDATPLSQLVNLYGNKLPKLREFARLKRRKENAHNKLLTGDLAGEYNGEKFTGSVLDVSKKWDAYRRRQPSKGRALDGMNQYGTLYKVFPDRTWEQQEQVDYSREGFTEEQRRKVWADLRQTWTNLGAEGQTIFKQTQAVYDAMWRAQAAAIYAERDRVNPGSKEFNAVVETAFRRIKQGPYSPLQRTGEFLVTVRDNAGKTVWFSGHDNGVEADTMIKDLRAGDFKDVQQFRIERTRRENFNWQQAGISAEALNQINTAAEAALPGDGNKHAREQLSAALVDAYLAGLPQQSFLQYANQRSGVAGVPTNSFRAFTEYVQKGARRISGVQYDGQISSALNELSSSVRDVGRGVTRDEQGNVITQEQGGVVDTAQLKQVVNAAVAQHEASLKYQSNPLADALSSAGFLWFMTSPSQMFINATQVAMTTVPKLVGNYGASGTLRAVKDALGTYAKSSGDLLGPKSALAEGSAELAVMRELRDRGTLDFTLTHDIANMGEGSLSAMSGHWRAITNLASTFIHKSEVFNRQVTAQAAVQLELKKRGWPSQGLSESQLETLANVAEDAVIDTQFDYSQSNKPPIMQGPYRRLVFQFQQYRFNMLAMMAKEIRDALPTTINGRQVPVITFNSTPEEKASARRTLAWLLGTQLAMTGAAGTVLAPFVFAIMDAFRDDEDLLDSRTEFVRSAPQWLAHGLVSEALGLDLSRIGSDTLIPILGQSAYAPADGNAKETMAYYVTQNLGPWFGLATNFATGVSSAVDGDHVKAIKSLAPKPIADLYTSAFESADGAKDTRQVVYYEPNAFESLSSALGLRSTGRREAEELRSASYKLNAKATQLQQRALTKLALGYSTGDQDLIAEAQASIDSFNARYPDMPITGSDIRRAVVSRVRSEVNADLYGLASPRAPSQTQQDLLNLR